MDRRDALRLLAGAPVAAGFAWTEAEASEAFQRAAAARQAATPATPFKPQFFTAHEYDTVRVLADLVLPRDERSGSATDAGVPEFMDFIVGDQAARQTAMRGGLAWLDRECQARFDKMFVDCAADQQKAVLDDIAWPQKAKPELSHGVRFFSSFRDLTATGFWTTKMGMEDLGYIGNKFVPEWTGCPDSCLKHLGVSYSVDKPTAQ